MLALLCLLACWRAPSAMTRWIWHGAGLTDDGVAERVDSLDGKMESVASALARIEALLSKPGRGCGVGGGDCVVWNRHSFSFCRRRHACKRCALETVNDVWQACFLVWGFQPREVAFECCGSLRTLPGMLCLSSFQSASSPLLQEGGHRRLREEAQACGVWKHVPARTYSSRTMPPCPCSPQVWPKQIEQMGP